MILGLDLSLTNTGVCLYSPSITPGAHTFATASIVPPKDVASPEERLDDIVSLVMQRTEGVSLVVIESLSFGHNTGAGSQIQALNWMVRCALARHRTRFLMVAPNALKKFVTGSGAAKKQEMLLAVYKRWGVEIRDDNQADAFGLAKIGAAFIDVERCENAAQREVIANLKNPPAKKVKARASAA